MFFFELCATTIDHKRVLTSTIEFYAPSITVRRVDCGIVFGGNCIIMDSEHSQASDDRR